MSADDSAFINAIASSLCSIVGNIILAIFVAKYTNKELKPYKKILVIQIIFDLMYSIVGPLSKYGRYLSNGILFYLFAKTNFGSILPVHFGACFATFATFISNAVENILPLHFIYRYFLICHNKTMGSFSLLIVSFCCLLPATLFATAFFFNFFPDENYEMYRELLRNSSDIFQNGTLPPFMATPFEKASKYSYIAILGSAIDYSIIAFCAASLVWHFRKNRSIMSPKTLQIQSQFNKMLFIEAVMPFLTSFVPQVLNYFGTWLKIPIFSFGSSYMVYFMPWTAALNPVVTIYVITTYRKRFLQIILCRTNISGFDSSTAGGDGSKTKITGSINQPTKING